MLLDELKLRDQIESAGTSCLEKFLDGYDCTAVQLACVFKSCSIIELLVEAGSDLKAIDVEGNTAIMVIAYSPPIIQMEFPKAELSPSIFKVNFISACCSLFFAEVLNLFFTFTDLQR